MPQKGGKKNDVLIIAPKGALCQPRPCDCAARLTALIKNTPRGEEMCGPPFHFAAIMLKYKLEEVEAETAPRESEE